jgi:hypothetical protein
MGCEGALDKEGGGANEGRSTGLGDGPLDPLTILGGPIGWCPFTGGLGGPFDIDPTELSGGPTPGGPI